MRQYRFFISLKGCDKNKGTLKSPFRSLAKALEHLRELNEKFPEEKNVTFFIRKGSYRLTSPIIITKTIWPYKYGKLRFCSYHNESVRLWGISQLALKETLKRVKDPERNCSPDGTLYKLENVTRNPQRLFVNGRAFRLATFPKHDDWEKWPSAKAGKKDNELLLPDGILADSPSSAKGLRLNFLPTPYTKWINYLSACKAVKGNAVFLNEPIIKNKMLKPPEWIPFRLENSMPHLEQPGEWCYDAGEKAVYFVVKSGKPVKTVNVPATSVLFKCEGVKDSAIANVLLRNLEFAYTARSDDASAKLGNTGAVVLEHTQDCQILKCRFREIGDNAIVSNSSRRLAIRNSIISKCDRAGIIVHGPVLTGEIESSHHLIEDCQLSDCGRIAWHSPGIAIHGSSHNTVRNCFFHDFPYAAILNGGFRYIFLKNDAVTFSPDAQPVIEEIKQQKSTTIESFKAYVAGYNRFEKNIIVDTMKKLDDGAAIYSHASHHNLFRQNLVIMTGRKNAFGLYFDDDETLSTMDNNVILHELNHETADGSSIHVHDNGKNTITHNVVWNCSRPFTFPSSYGGHHVVNNIFAIGRGEAVASIPPARNAGRYGDLKWDAGENYWDYNLYIPLAPSAQVDALIDKMHQLGFDQHSRQIPATDISLSLLFRKSLLRKFRFTGISMLPLKNNPGWKVIRKRLLK